MSSDEIEEFIGKCGDAVLTTLRADGRAAPVPVWYITLDGSLYFRTPRRSRKITNLKRDPRVTVLIDAGELWSELRGVVLQSEATFVDDAGVEERVRHAFGVLFKDRVSPTAAMPEASKKYYAADVILRVPIPAEPSSWDNRKMRTRAQ